MHCALAANMATLQSITNSQISTLCDTLSNNHDICAVEEGWPLLGMTPEIVSNKFNMKHLFEKHGGPFVVNASLMGGYALFVEEGDDILEAQTVRQNEMEMVVLRMFHC